MAREQWVFDPDSGGVKMPDHETREVTRRIERFAAEDYAGQHTRLAIRFRVSISANPQQLR